MVRTVHKTNGGWKRAAGFRSSIIASQRNPSSSFNASLTRLLEITRKRSISELYIKSPSQFERNKQVYNHSRRTDRKRTAKNINFTLLISPLHTSSLTRRAVTYPSLCPGYIMALIVIYLMSTFLFVLVVYYLTRKANSLKGFLDDKCTVINFNLLCSEVVYKNCIKSTWIFWDFWYQDGIEDIDNNDINSWRHIN